MELHSFQRELVGKAQAAYREGARSVLLQSATGSGKTFMAARGIIVPTVARGRRVVFAADLEEIIDDTATRLRDLGLEVGIVKSGRAETPSAPVQVCSLQTLARRKSGLPPADRFVIDEAHISEARTIKAVMKLYEGAKFLGLTATPARGDGKPLGEFERMICGPTMRELIELGHLVRPRVFAPGKILDKGVARDPVEVMLENRDRRFIVFAPNALEARRIADQATAAGHSTETVLDDTPKDERRLARARVASGDVRSLVSVSALRKGFDAPVIDAVILTQMGTITSFLQSVGRAMRVSPGTGKTDAMIWDLRGAVYAHGLPEDDRAWSLDGEQGKSLSDPGMSIRTCRSCHAVFPTAIVCPRCGSRAIIDPRPLRVQRAEMFEQSSRPIGERARIYLESLEAKFVRNGMRPRAAYELALKRLPKKLREAL